MKDDHPSPDLLKRFVCSTPNGIDPAECRRVVRHLIRGCPACQEVTRGLLFGEAGENLLAILGIVDCEP